MDIIDEFLRSYAREVDFYQEAARLCGQACEQQLRSAGKRAIVTYRAKNPQRLGEKLRKRDQKQHYTDAQTITEDIIDLAGVRIALYFPTDQKDVDASSRGFSHSPAPLRPSRNATDLKLRARTQNNSAATTRSITLYGSNLTPSEKTNSDTRAPA